MAVKVYTPGQFYAAGGVVEEMFYQEVGRTKKYLRKRGDLPLRDIYWWERNDKESRIKAFDKLIGIYEAKVNGRAL